MTALRLDKIELENFRCFASCGIEFHPRLTVLVAENANGKTALLDAAAQALSVYVNALYPREAIKKIERTDVRLVAAENGAMEPRLPSGFAADGIVGGESVRWASHFETFGEKSRPTTRNLKTIQVAALTSPEPTDTLPLVAFYGTGRLWGEYRQRGGRRTSVTAMSERLGGYADCLSSSSSFKGVSAWYEQRVTETRSPAYKEALATNLALLTTVREAARTVLDPTGWSDLDWDKDSGNLVAEHERSGRLPLTLLSDGVRTMLALVADVARRCASLNPQFGGQAASKTPGVLLIDEVDMHLHPRWQQLVVELLCNAFPALQIIVTTHSPQVLSTVDKDSIRVISVHDGQGVIETPQFQTKGVESADVLASVMGVDPVPQTPEARDLSIYRAHIEDGHSQSAEAISLRSKLVDHFGDRHPVMLDCDRLIRFQEFRLRRQSSEGA